MNKMKRATQHTPLESAQLRALKLAKARGIDGQLTNSHEFSLERRYQHRQILEAKQKQHNLETIMRQVISGCGDNTGEDPDPDWLTAFLSLAENIASKKMQKLWSQILTMEISHPGRFSVKSLQTLKSMTQKEAQLFQRACALCSNINADHGKKLLIGYNKPAPTFSLLKTAEHIRLNLGRFKLPYSAILLLSDLGILHSSELESSELEMNALLPIYYNDMELQLQPLDKKIRLVYYRFTPIGNELAHLIPSAPITDYQQTLFNLFAADFDCSCNNRDVINTNRDN